MHTNIQIYSDTYKQTETNTQHTDIRIQSKRTRFTARELSMYFAIVGGLRARARALSLSLSSFLLLLLLWWYLVLLFLLLAFFRISHACCFLLLLLFIAHMYLYYIAIYWAMHTHPQCWISPTPSRLYTNIFTYVYEWQSVSPLFCYSIKFVVCLFFVLCRRVSVTFRQSYRWDSDWQFMQLRFTSHHIIAKSKSNTKP